MELAYDFDNVKDDYLRYLGLVKDQRSAMEESLSKLIEKRGSGVLTHPEVFPSLAVAEGLALEDALGIALVMGADGANQLLKEPVLASDIDRLVRNAEESTGLTRTSIMRIVRAIALAVGAAVDVTPEDSSSRGSYEACVEESAYVLPMKAYELPLREFRVQFQKVLSEYRDDSDKENGQTSQDQITEIDKTLLRAIEPLVAAGIPEAKYYLGTCLLYGLSGNPSKELGERLLREAAAAGNAEASAVLGDYYYSLGIDEWEEAYRYYSGFGSSALSPDMQERLSWILELGKAGRRTLIASIGMLAAMLVILIIVPGASVHPALRIWGTLCFLASGSFLVVGMMHRRVSPYEGFGYVPTGMLVAWTLYICARVLL